MLRVQRLHCSFCGKNEQQVERLIAGPRVYICDACIDACIEILGAEPEWCEKQISNLARLHAQASHDLADQDPLPNRAHDPNWLGRLFR